VIHGPRGARQHIWSFIVSKNDIQVTSDNCPCSNTAVTWLYSTPSFLGNNYFCDTGRHVGGATPGILESLEVHFTRNCLKFVNSGEYQFNVRKIHLESLAMAATRFYFFSG